MSEEDAFSHKVHDQTIGSLHDHQFLWKLDADILGTSNALMAVSLSKASQTSPWGGLVPPTTQWTLQVDMNEVANEAEGSSTLDIDLDDPVHFHVRSEPEQLNDWGQPRSYMVEVHTHMHQLLKAADDPKWLPGSEWTQHDVWATVRKENGREERGGWPHFDMQAPYEAIEPFSGYTDGETLTGSDIVLWIVHGVLHVPSSEDVPVTYSTSDGTGWTFRPYNYGRHSAIRDLRSGMVIRGATGLAVDQGVPKPSQDCVAETPKFEYHGVPE
jgi:primary-amine oxidase